MLSQTALVCSCSFRNMQMYAFEVLGGLSSSSAGFPSLEGHSLNPLWIPSSFLQRRLSEVTVRICLTLYSCFRFCVCVCVSIQTSCLPLPFFLFFADIAFILYLPSKKTHSFILVQTLCSYYLSLYNMSHIVETLRLVMFSFIGWSSLQV